MLHPPSAPFLDSGLSTLQAVGEGVYRAEQHDANMNGRVFGGQLLAQALLAAQAEAARDARTPWHPASLHCLFLHGAQVGAPLGYTASALHAGSRFRSYRVAARQEPRNVVEAQVTLQQALQAWEHEQAAPDVPEPERLPPLDSLRGADGQSYAGHQRPGLEMRLVDPGMMRHAASAPAVSYWVRLQRAPGGDLALHHAALAYLSDFWINTAAVSHHLAVDGARDRLFVASLNHSLWFHRWQRVDDWLLFVCESPAMRQGRALNWLRIYDRQRRLLASAAQDSVIGERVPAGPGAQDKG